MILCKYKPLLDLMYGMDWALSNKFLKYQPANGSIEMKKSRDKSG